MAETLAAPVPADPATAPVAAPTSKPTLHHLNNSQSQRVLWLLEELEIDYDVRLYQRGKLGEKHAGRAPPELKDVHGQGKSPVLVTASGKAIAETSAIALYLIETYDKEGKFKGDPAPAEEELDRRVDEENLISFISATLQPVTSQLVIFSVATVLSPPLGRFLVRAVLGKLKDLFAKPSVAGQLAYLEKALGDSQWLLGSKPSRADFLLEYPLSLLHQNPQWVDLARFPKLKAWLERVYARPAWKRGLEKGNGYSLKWEDEANYQ